MNRLRRILRKFVRGGIDSQTFVEYLRHKGVTVGEGTYFFDPQSTRIDVRGLTCCLLAATLRLQVA